MMSLRLPAAASRWTFRAACVLLAATFLTDSLRAENRFEISAPDLLTGATGAVVDVLADNDEVVLGYSIALNWNPAIADVVAVSNVDTVAADADYFEGQIDHAGGKLAYGCVFDIGGDFSEKFLAAGTGHVIAKLTIDVLATSDTTLDLVFETVAIEPNLQAPTTNVLTNTLGVSLLPTTVNGSIDISTAVPVIEEIVDGCGREDTQFQVVGDEFGFGGLTVMVCGVEASATLRADGRTLDVIAPACGTTDGCVDVVVTTERGSDTVVDGFCYKPEPIPTLTSVTPDSGGAGTMLELVGSNFGESGLVVRICGVEAVAEAPSPDGTSVVVTAPECDETGPVDVEVCNDFGCTTLVGAFSYPVGALFVRGDASSSGNIDLSSGIVILQFLFQGTGMPSCDDAADADDSGLLDLTDAIRIFGWLFTGATAPPPPSPSAGAYAPGDCGFDPTPDGLGCDTLSPVCSA